MQCDTGRETVMKIYICTDLEGVAGVMNYRDYLFADSRYYEKAKRLLTEEVNAAIAGFAAAGANEFIVADGHGAGAIEQELLDERAMLLRGFPGPYPFGIDRSCAAVAFVGQHAMSRTANAHLPHTQWHGLFDCRINGKRCGEFAQICYCAAEIGVPIIFGSGDQAFCAEAAELVEGIQTVWVKQGLDPASGDECSFEQYENHGLAALHCSPGEARRRICAGAEAALKRFCRNPESFGKIRLQVPFEEIMIYRAAEGREGYSTVRRHPESVIACMNQKEEKL